MDSYGWILESKSKKFTDSGIQIPYWGETLLGSKICISEKLWKGNVEEEEEANLG